MASILRAMTLHPCVFCGAPPPLTKEHVIGKWIAKYTPKQGTYELIQQDANGQTRRIHGRTISQYQPKIVCGKCNWGWMSDLEGRAETILGPMIKPHREGEVHVRMTVAQQRVVAAWATKVALLIPYTSPTPDPASPHHLAQLYRHKRPPRSFAVWIGTYAGTGAYHAFARNRVRWVRLRSERGRNGEGAGHLVCFHVGHVIFVVFAGATWRPYTADAPRAAINGGMPRLWPSTRRIVEWPTPLILNREGFDRLPSIFPWLPGGSRGT